jgi:hypothetical protein
MKSFIFQNGVKNYCLHVCTTYIQIILNVKPKKDKIVHLFFVNLKNKFYFHDNQKILQHMLALKNCDLFQFNIENKLRLYYCLTPEPYNKWCVRTNMKKESF